MEGALLISVHLFTKNAPIVKMNFRHRPQELCESRGGRPGLPVPNNPFGFCGRKATFEEAVYHSELRSCVKVEVVVLGSPSLIIPMVSVDVKLHLKKLCTIQSSGAV